MTTSVSEEDQATKRVIVVQSEGFEMTSVKEDQSQKRVVVVQSLSGLKHAIYLIVALFSFVLFVVSCVVVPYEKDTYGGYNPPAAELAFIGGFGALFIPIFVWSQRVRPDSGLNSMAAELGLSSFMWFFLLGGVGALTEQTYDLPACQDLFICRGFSTMMGFSWMSWILITILLGFKLFVLANLWSHRLPIHWRSSVKDLYLESMGHKKSLGSVGKSESGPEPVQSESETKDQEQQHAEV